MSSRSGSHVKLEGRHELSERQQEVLGLMAEGRTNYEIAEALDLSLEGAKYHVSEILGKLGVDSREEAIAWWRGHRPMRERLPQRIRFLWPALGWVGGVAAVGVAGLVVLGVVLHFVGTSPGSSDSGPATVWVAVANLGSVDSPGELTLMLPGTPSPAKVLANGNFYGVAWSPDGQTLAVFPYLPTNGPSLLLYSRATWTAKTIPLPATPSEPPQWSPDGKHLAIVSDSVLFLTADGAKVAETAATQPPAHIYGSGKTIMLSGWSPDSKLFVTTIYGGIQVSDLEGHVVDLDPARAGVQGGSSRFTVAGWQSADTLEVFDSAAFPTVFYRVTINSGSQSWEAFNSSGTPIPMPTGAQGTAPGHSVLLIPQGGSYPHTADGRGTVRELGVSPPPLSPPLSPVAEAQEGLAVDYKGVTTHIQLPQSLEPMSRGWNYDVVITGGR
ncbi:MAG TPA: LuxR C-terminal-related transcriptional regulator [Candidatus Saccharimonadales bacterium]|nr:LuxR C-terminal-related transcriptional regulator [Candidatus Saccharimonadales bacterium]